LRAIPPVIINTLIILVPELFDLCNKGSNSVTNTKVLIKRFFDNDMVRLVALSRVNTKVREEAGIGTTELRFFWLIVLLKILLLLLEKLTKKSFTSFLKGVNSRCFDPSLYKTDELLPPFFSILAGGDESTFNGLDSMLFTKL
jgi:hypothetical protein